MILFKVLILFIFDMHKKILSFMIYITHHSYVNTGLESRANFIILKFAPFVRSYAAGKKLDLVISRDWLQVATILNINESIFNAVNMRKILRWRLLWNSFLADSPDWLYRLLKLLKSTNERTSQRLLNLYPYEMGCNILFFIRYFYLNLLSYILQIQ